ncbi:vWA domain-containing protein [Methanobrevibacter curvatus]|uniref:Magnesium-chelatase 60 kDa subunit n=1 Tax=Methanobrevibacter curvatus TaxID=49547 RepID=A0A162FPK3_9EURY|nr:VWA domain-containing protein [Methanobrevibacter curvatus]KZX13200.1 magnesium-chelatase 60 kDa subunit [Methanobrevibacter curvatus]
MLLKGCSKKKLYGKHVDSKNEKGKYVKSRFASKLSKDIAIDATLRSAVGHSQGKINVRKEDLREKIRKHKARGSIALVIDMSGSMVSDKKINRIKAILELIINNTIKHKDKLSVVGFKGKKSEIIIPNTKYPKSFLSKLDTVTVGGTTPIAIGLKKGIEVLKKDIKENEYIPMLILLSDGRPNVGLGGGPIQDTLEVGKEIANEKIHNIIIDFDRTSGQGRNFNKELAFNSKGTYYNLEKEMNTEHVIEGILNHERLNL